MSIPKTLPKRIAIVATVIVLVAWMVYAFMPQPVGVDVATVDRGALTVVVREEAMTRVRDVYRLSAPVAGRLLRVEADAGDPVVAGETVLVRLLPTDPALLDTRSRSQAQAAVRSAEAALNLAQAEVSSTSAQLEYARSELARMEKLSVQQTVSEADLDRARLAVKTAQAAQDTAQAAVQVRRAELDNARAVLSTPGDGMQTIVELRAPVDGTVLQRLQESETVVAAGAPLVEVGNAHELEVMAELLSTDAVKVQAGAPVRIERWGGVGEVEGVVRRVEPYGFTKVSALGIEEQRVRVLIDFKGEPPSGLAHGYRVEVAIVVWQGGDVLRVPASALFRQEGGWAVFRVEDGRAVPVAVSIGHSDGLQAEVVEGLSEGDTVIVHPSERIEEGSRVAGRPQSM